MLNSLAIGRQNKYEFVDRTLWEAHMCLNPLVKFL